MVDRKQTGGDWMGSCTQDALTVCFWSFYMAYLAWFQNRLASMYAVTSTLTYTSGQKVLKTASWTLLGSRWLDQYLPRPIPIQSSVLLKWMWDWCQNDIIKSRQHCFPAADLCVICSIELLKGQIRELFQTMNETAMGQTSLTNCSIN